MLVNTYYLKILRMTGIELLQLARKTSEFQGIFFRSMTGFVTSDAPFINSQPATSMMSHLLINELDNNSLPESKPRMSITAVGPCRLPVFGKPLRYDSEGRAEHICFRLIRAKTPPELVTLILD
ncbi:hypothetical protein J6590_040356 [Homalodisca vitripennis]|nr:hypothetical protein J6590_040356 [Homalodisca vitripennis]